MTDLIARLRAVDGKRAKYFRNPDGMDAAYEIERLMCDLNEALGNCHDLADKVCDLEHALNRVIRERDAAQSEISRLRCAITEIRKCSGGEFDDDADDVLAVVELMAINALRTHGQQGGKE